MISDYIKITQAIKQHAKNLSPIATMAQWFLESGYRPNQKMSKLSLPPNYNLFGIKANDKEFTPDKQGVTWDWFDTHEHVDGKKIPVIDKFRIYKSYEESIKDHDHFFISTPSRVERYRRVRESNNIDDEIRELGQSGYATDPNYSAKLWGIINTYDLINLMNGVGESMRIVDRLLNQNDIEVIDRRQYALGGQAVNRKLSDIKVIVWHYTAVPRSYNRKIWDHETYWKNTHGWDRGGYHFYIDSDGVLYINYNPERITWGVAHNNNHTIHISVEANSKTDYSQKQLEVRDYVTRILMDELSIPASKVQGHWEVFNNTSCPGYTRAEMDVFRANLGVSRDYDSYNPQGLPAEKPAEYTPPKLPFKRLEIGDSVTIEKGDWKWYSLEKEVLLKSERQEELSNTSDVIVDIKDIKQVSSSQVAYKLEKYNSWILEEYLQESKSHWKLVSNEEEHANPHLDGNYLSWQGKRYKIGNEIK